MIKKILIALGILIVSTGITIGVLYAVKQAQTEPTATDNTSTHQVTPDLSKDYGACRVVSVSSIKTALGSAAKELQEPENMGLVSDKQVGEDVESIVSDSQLCTYAFTPGGTIENGYNANNALTIKQIIYTTKAGAEAATQQIKDINDPATSVVAQLGDAAFYTSATAAQGPGATFSFILQVFKAEKSTAYVIRQPAESATFTAESAKTALIALAKTATN